ncbi:MAG: VCBS repeat-containing protein [Chloroflexota bacterium]
MENTYRSMRFGNLIVLGMILLGIISFSVFAYNLDRGGTYHNSINLADLDNDGDMDVILQNVRNESEFTAFAVLTLWFNEENGTFTPMRMEDYQSEAGWASTAGDVDQDGDADLFVYHGYRLRVDFNLGGVQGGNPGEFGRSQFITQPRSDAQYGSLLLGDLNNDNILDGIVTGCCGRVFTLDAEDDTPNFTWVWINASTPTGILAPQSSAISALDGLSLSAAALGDLDNDGDLDLFAAVIAPNESRNTDPSDRVIINDGLGNFTDSGQRLGNADSTSVDLGDIDNDGDMDALVGNENGAYVWINQGGKQNGEEADFTLSSQIISGSQTLKVLLSDFDNDNDLDVLIAGINKAILWWNDGQGNFTKSNQSFRYSKRYGIIVGDFNNDNSPDVFVAEYSDNYKVWYNNGNGTFRTRASTP